MDCVICSSVLDEQLRMNDCYYDTKDWRVCRKEVSSSCIPKCPTFGLLGQLLTVATDRWKPSENAGKGMATTRGLQARTSEHDHSHRWPSCIL